MTLSFGAMPVHERCERRVSVWSCTERAALHTELFIFTGKRSKPRRERCSFADRACGIRVM